MRVKKKHLFNFPGIRKGRQNNSGIILIVVLWILVILTMLSIGVSQRSRMELSLTKYSMDRVKAKYAAWAGLTYAMKMIQQDTADEDTSKFDTLYQCGVDLNEQSLNIPFENISLKGGNFNIKFESKDLSHFGFEDTERKINLNAINQQNYKVLAELIKLFGYSENLAETVGASVVDWHDVDDNESIQNVGAEDEYYTGLAKPYHCKNNPFDSIEELLLVREVSEEVYQSIKDYVTVYPKQGGSLRINFDTASDKILTALGRSIPTASEADVDSMVQKIIDFRKGPDEKEYTEDDEIIDRDASGLNLAEKAIFDFIAQYRTKTSNYIHVKVTGAAKNSKTTYTIDTIVSRK